MDMTRTIRMQSAESMDIYGLNVAVETETKRDSGIAKNIILTIDQHHNDSLRESCKKMVELICNRYIFSYAGLIEFCVAGENDTNARYAKLHYTSSCAKAGALLLQTYRLCREAAQHILALENSEKKKEMTVSCLKKVAFGSLCYSISGSTPDDGLNPIDPPLQYLHGEQKCDQDRAMCSTKLQHAGKPVGLVLCLADGAGSMGKNSKGDLITALCYFCQQYPDLNITDQLLDVCVNAIATQMNADGIHGTKVTNEARRIIKNEKTRRSLGFYTCCEVLKHARKIAEPSITQAYNNMEKACTTAESALSRAKEYGDNNPELIKTKNTAVDNASTMSDKYRSLRDVTYKSIENKIYKEIEHFLNNDAEHFYTKAPEQKEDWENLLKMFPKELEELKKAALKEFEVNYLSSPGDRPKTVATALSLSNVGIHEAFLRQLFANATDNLTLLPTKVPPFFSLTGPVTDPILLDGRPISQEIRLTLQKKHSDSTTGNEEEEEFTKEWMEMTLDDYVLKGMAKRGTWYNKGLDLISALVEKTENTDKPTTRSHIIPIRKNVEHCLKSARSQRPPSAPATDVNVCDDIFCYQDKRRKIVPCLARNNDAIEEIRINKLFNICGDICEKQPTFRRTPLEILMATWIFKMSTDNLVNMSMEIKRICRETETGGENKTKLEKLVGKSLFKYAQISSETLSSVTWKMGRKDSNPDGYDPATGGAAFAETSLDILTKPEFGLAAAIHCANSYAEIKTNISAVVNAMDKYICDRHFMCTGGCTLSFVILTPTIAIAVSLGDSTIRFMSKEGAVQYVSEGNAIRTSDQQQIDCRFKDGRYIFNNEICVRAGTIITGKGNGCDHLYCIGHGKYKYPSADGFILNMPEIHIQPVDTISYVVLLSDGLDAKYTTKENNSSRANVESVLRGIHCSVAARATISKTMTNVFERTSFSDNLKNDDCSLAIAVLNPPPVGTPTIISHIAEKIISDGAINTDDNPDDNYYKLIQLKTFILFLCGAATGQLKTDDGTIAGYKTPKDRRALIGFEVYDLLSTVHSNIIPGMLLTEDYNESSLRNTLFMYEPYFMGYIMQLVDFHNKGLLVKSTLHIEIDTFVNGLRTHPSYYKDLYETHLSSATFNIDGGGHFTAKRGGIPIQDYLKTLLLLPIPKPVTRKDGTKRNLIDIVTDVGEETDDEVTCLHLYNICEHNRSMIARVFFTNKAGQTMFKRLLGERPDLPNFSTFDFNERTFEPNTEKTLLVQISPIPRAQFNIVQAYATKQPFDYILLGELGTTLNSSKRNGADQAATFLLDEAAWGVCVATGGGSGAPPFTVAGLKSVGGVDSAIVNHCLAIAFRNTVGRASSTGGRFVAHLVAKDKMGANYQTALSISKRMGLTSRRKPSSDKVKKVVDSYIAALQEGDPESPESALVVKYDDDSTNSVRPGITLQKIKDGYTFILETLHQAFGVPVDFFASQTPSQKWAPQWEFQPESPRFEATFSGIRGTEIHAQMRKAFDKFSAVAKEDPDMPLTPAYDCVALAAAFDYFRGTPAALARFDRGVHDRPSNEIVLKPDIRAMGLAEILKKETY